MFRGSKCHFGSPFFSFSHRKCFHHNLHARLLTTVNKLFRFDCRTIHLFDSTFSKQVGLKMFLGVTASVTNWDADGTSCSLVLEDNPLVDFVELPDTCQGLYYCNILSGVIRGALEMVRAFAFLVSIFTACWQLWWCISVSIEQYLSLGRKARSMDTSFHLHLFLLS